MRPFARSTLIRLLVAAGVAAMLAVWFFRAPGGTANIEDGSQASSISLTARQGTFDVSGIRVHLSGYISGEVTVRLGNSEPVALRGNVNQWMYKDCFSESCTLAYSPIDAKSGHLKVRYRFVR